MRHLNNWGTGPNPNLEACELASELSELCA